ncbi:MAG: benzoate/H(+) symporter BenE family transporter [Actinomycetota bacterium]
MTEPKGQKLEFKAPILAGFVASTSGSLATFGIAIAGLVAMGANRDQTFTALFVSLIGYGVLSMALSYRYKLPISIVWSTPGAAFLAASYGLGLSFEQAVGGFLLSGFLLTLTGLWPALTRLVTKIPSTIASAMLAGVLFVFVLSTVKASVHYPLLVMPVVVIWLLLNRLATVWATPIAIVLAFLLVNIDIGSAWLEGAKLFPEFRLVLPSFDLIPMISIGIPLYLITMASQNLPGIAVMKSLGYEVPVRAVLGSTGLATMFISFFGAFGLNLAAITAAINANEHAAKDPSRRWFASFVGGLVYWLFAVGAGLFAAFVLAVPNELLLAVVGLALLPSFISSIGASVEDKETRLPATITFLVGAAGITIFGIGGAFWALVTGILVLAWQRFPLKTKS